MSKDFEELFACLTARNARALVVGGYAVAYHAKPRFTKDIDILVDPTGFRQCGASSTGLGRFRLRQSRRDQQRTLLQAESSSWACRRTASISSPPLTVSPSWRHGPVGALDPSAPNPVFYIGRAESIRNKRASGRPQDLADVDALEP